MNQAELDKLHPWIGRTVEATDEVTGRLVDSYRATFGAALAPVGEGEAPLALHWCLAPHLASATDLGPDGHTTREGFLPPVPLPRRMWAGGEVEWLAPLHLGDVVRRRSTIADIRLKQGRSGQLCFVTTSHELATPSGPAIRERQELVFRAATGGADSSAQAATPAAPVGHPDLTWRIDASPVLLFRYSALTFNAHRIHYDQPYATRTEGYAGLVVHGPLQASLLLNLAAALGGGPPGRFSYRAVAPLIAGGEFEVCVAMQRDRSAQCWVRDRTGRTTMTAAAAW
jgi:3-methylfumaryl-CoA hydratase